MLKHARVSIYGSKYIVNFHMWLTVVYTGGGGVGFDLFLFCFLCNLLRQHGEPLDD